MRLLYVCTFLENNTSPLRPSVSQPWFFHKNLSFWRSVDEDLEEFDGSINVNFFGQVNNSWIFFARWAVRLMCFVFLLVPFCKYERSWYIFSYLNILIDMRVSMCIYVSSFFDQRYRPTLEIFQGMDLENIRQQKVLPLPRPRRWMCFCVRDSPEGDVFLGGSGW